jgi:hypothetical protein
MNTLKSILKNENLNLSNNPKGTDKGDMKSYIDFFYEKYFSPRQKQKINLLEIGFRHGASLALWSRYFVKGNIIGIDNLSDVSINQGSKPIDSWINRSNVKIIFNNAYDILIAKSITEKFDIIIDDGPHSLLTQKKALKLYLPKLKKNGIFVIEDIQRFGGLAIFPLLLNVPYKYQVKFFDFRSHKKGNDDILFVVFFEDHSAFFSRLKILGQGFLYLFFEPYLFLRRKFLGFNL